MRDRMKKTRNEIQPGAKVNSSPPAMARMKKTVKIFFFMPS